MFKLHAAITFTSMYCVQLLCGFLTLPGTRGTWRQRRLLRTCVCTALFSWITHAHVMPLFITKRRPVHFILNQRYVEYELGVLMVWKLSRPERDSKPRYPAWKSCANHEAIQPTYIVYPHVSLMSLNVSKRTLLTSVLRAQRRLRFRTDLSEWFLNGLESTAMTSVSGHKIKVMHQSFDTPPTTRTGTARTSRGLSAVIKPPMSPGSAVDVPGYWFSVKMIWYINKRHVNLKLQFSNTLAHTVNDTLRLELPVLSKPDLLPRKRYRLIFATESRLFQETKAGPGWRDF